MLLSDATRSKTKICPAAGGNGGVCGTCGLRARGDQQKGHIRHERVRCDGRGARIAGRAMAASTAITVSAHFEAFVARGRSAYRHCGHGIEVGISGTGEAAPHDPWHAYGARSTLDRAWVPSQGNLP